MFHKVGSIFPPSFPSPTLRRNINRYVKRRARLFQCCKFLLKLKFLRLCCCYIMWNEVKCLQQSDYIYVPASWNGREKKIHAKVIVHSRSQGCRCFRLKSERSALVNEVSLRRIACTISSCMNMTVFSPSFSSVGDHFHRNHLVPHAV